MILCCRDINFFIYMKSAKICPLIIDEWPHKLNYEFAKEIIEKSGNIFFNLYLCISCFWAKSNPIGINVKSNFAFLSAVRPKV